MDRPDYLAPGAGPEPDEHKHVPIWVTAFVALLFSIPVILIVVLFVN